MNHGISDHDRQFIADLEACALEPSQFDHGAHVRAAYIYLTERTTDQAAERMRDTLLTFLRHHGIEASKYHETITRAWILAVRHFMERSRVPGPRRSSYRPTQDSLIARLCSRTIRPRCSFRRRHGRSS